jgi:single-strand DNA-binding protein
MTPKESNMSYASINRVVLIGRLTKDPELHELPSGQSVCDLRIACNGIRRDADGEYRERPHFFDVGAFGGLAENVARYMHKGSLVAIDGRLDWREWETAEQQKRQTVRVVAENVQFLERPAGERGEGDGGDGAAGTDAPEALDGERQAGERELVGAGVGAGEVDLVF